MDFPDDHVQALGAAGLLHDVGKADVPTEILNKPGKLDAEEWRIIEGHPVAGARILLESGGGLELPAVVAYEHHLGFEEGGYPDLHYERRTLPESRLVQVCDFYDALRTRRRYRKPLMAAEVVRILRRNEGKSLDPRFVEAMASLIERWDPSAVLAEIRPEDEAVDEDPDALEGADPASLP
jgi:HD-GYP domain-containing protein (c-di-GMP phosphodiesterase class II)